MDELFMPHEEKKPDIVLATVTEVTATGIKIQIDGNDTAGEKEYKCNSAQVFSVGDRVKINENSGTIIVEYRIGTPGETVMIPAGGQDGDALVKDGSTDYKLKWASGGAGSTSKLVNGNYELDLSSTGVLSAANSSRKVALGSSNIPFNDCYIGGSLHVGTSQGDKIGFFGQTPVARQSVSNSATVGQLITALKAYGLIV